MGAQRSASRPRDQFGNWKFTAGWWLTVQTCRLEANQGGDAATSAFALRLTNAVVSLSRRLGTLAVSRAGGLAFGPHLAPDWGKGNEARALTASYLGALQVGEDQEGEVEMQNRM